MFENHTKKNEIIETLLNPHKSYLNDVKTFLDKYDYDGLHGMAHITGGGIPGNLNRVLPDGCHAVVKESSWQWPALFTWMMDTANIERSEMYRTFNCGVGMILVVDEADVEKSIKLLTEAGETAFVVGDIKDGESEQQVHIV
jgi:phosphoribosylformylglycinamidine cyclo-ligase